MPVRGSGQPSPGAENDVGSKGSSGPRASLLALLLLLPAPSIGTVVAMVSHPGPTGQAVFALCKLWLLGFPATWFLLVDRGRPSLSPPRHGGLAVGALTGAAAGALIVGAYLTLALPHVDPEPLRTTVAEIGLGSPVMYLAGAAYWILLNSLIEEYVYRWFILTRCERLMPGGLAILASAAAFTVHHVIALQVFLSPGFTALASFGVFAGGVLWAWCYRRYRSIWPGWLSHVLADLAIFAVGWHMVFAP